MVGRFVSSALVMLMTSWPEPECIKTSYQQKEDASEEPGMILRQHDCGRLGEVHHRRGQDDDSVNRQQYSNEEPYRQHVGFSAHRETSFLCNAGAGPISLVNLD